MTRVNPARLTVERALALWVTSRRVAAGSRSTIRMEVACLRRLLPRLGRSLARVRTQDVERYFAERSREVSTATRARELCVLRGLYRLLVSRGLASRDPTEGLRISVRHREPLVLSQREVQALLVEASKPIKARRSPELCEAIALRNRAALELLYGLGLRASEVCGLLLVNLDLAGATARVERAKRCRPACLPLPAASIPHLQRYLAQARPLLLRKRDRCEGRVLANERGRPLSVGHLERLLARVAARAGLRAHPHALRRSLATHLVQGGASLPAVQHLLGHESLDTTQRYVAHGIEHLREVVERLSGPEGRGIPPLSPSECSDRDT